MARLLFSIDRGKSIADAEDTLRLVESLRKDFTVVCGIDFSGNPCKGRFSDFVGLLQNARDAGLKVTLHAAEVPEAEPIADDDTEMSQMIRFRPDRFGHALHLRPHHVQVSLAELIAQIQHNNMRSVSFILNPEFPLRSPLPPIYSRCNLMRTRNTLLLGYGSIIRIHFASTQVSKVFVK